MFNLVTSLHRIMYDFTTIDPPCVTAPPIPLFCRNLIEYIKARTGTVLIDIKVVQM